MAKKEKSSLPPSDAARENVLTVIRSTSEPWMARAISKLLVAPHQIKEADLVPILDEFVATGALYAYPPKTAKGKPRYWDRDVATLARGAILAAAGQADAPLTAKQVTSSLSGAAKLTEAEAAAILDAFVASGTLHAIPAATAKGKGRYWHGSLSQFAKDAMLRLVQSKGPQTEANLKKAGKGCADADLRRILQEALAARELWRHPALGKAGKELFAGHPPSPEPYLRTVGTQLTTVIAGLLDAGVPREEVRRHLVQMIEGAGISFASNAATSALSAPHDTDSPQSGSVDLVALMRRIESGADRGALVAARDLRRAAHLDKPQFDRMVLELSRQGRVSLHRHDFAASLSPAERDELVTDGAGTFYVGMALRQNNA